MKPTEGDFERAKALMRARLGEEASVRSKLEPILKLLAPVTEVAVFKHRDSRWEVWAFVATEAALRRAVERGFLDRGPSLVKEALTECGYGPEADIRLLFRIESEEHARRHPAHRYNSDGRAEFRRLPDDFFDAAK